MFAAEHLAQSVVQSALVLFWLAIVGLEQTERYDMSSSRIELLAGLAEALSLVHLTYHSKVDSEWILRSDTDSSYSWSL